MTWQNKEILRHKFVGLTIFAYLCMLYERFHRRTGQIASDVSSSLIDSIEQCNRVLLNIQLDYNTRSLAFDIKRYFEINEKAVEVLIFKGKRHFSIRRFTVTRSDYMPLFKKFYER